MPCMGWGKVNGVVLASGCEGRTPSEGVQEWRKRGGLRRWWYRVSRVWRSSKAPLHVHIPWRCPTPQAPRIGTDDSEELPCAPGNRCCWARCWPAGRENKRWVVHHTTAQGQPPVVH